MTNAVIDNPQVDWREVNGQLRPFLQDEQLAWASMPGSQSLYLSCPYEEVLYTGTRGGGKTECALMDFFQDVGKGWGTHWVGVLFRKTFPTLRDVVAKSRRLFERVCPEARFLSNAKDYCWVFPDGERLYFRSMKDENDYEKQHGQEYAWIHWEELTLWADPTPYFNMFSTLRAPVAGMPLKVRGTTNPGGPGSNWVKEHFDLPMPPGQIAHMHPDDPNRCVINSHLHENLVLMHANPDYEKKLRKAAKNPMQLKAWLQGSWDISSGGRFDDIWTPSVHVVDPFPLQMIPRGWKIDRSYDHGASSPYSMGVWAESNGEVVEWNGRTYGEVAGDLFRISELYGAKRGHNVYNEGLDEPAHVIASKIVEFLDNLGIGARVRPGPADNQIFADYDPGNSVSKDMLKKGLRWLKSDKSPGSRKQGWQAMYTMLYNALPPEEPGMYREEPGLFVFSNCRDFTRTLPGLPRKETDPDDVDKRTAEDHAADEARYRIYHKRNTTKVRHF